MYDPITARFLQEDTYTGDPNDPLSLNLYTYCANNPLMYHDPTGHFFKEIYKRIKERAKKVLTNIFGSWKKKKQTKSNDIDVISCADPGVDDTYYSSQDENEISDPNPDNSPLKWFDELQYNIANEIKDLSPDLNYDAKVYLTKHIIVSEGESLKEKYRTTWNAMQNVIAQHITCPNDYNTLSGLYEMFPDEKDDSLGAAFLRGFFKGVDAGIWFSAGEGIQTPNKWLKANMLDDLANSGVKHSADDVLAVTKTPSGKITWLERGNSKAGLEHILEHADDFANKGVNVDQIQDLIMESVTNGKIVGYQGQGTGRAIYEVVYNGQKQYTAVTIGNNGFIVGANPTSWLP